MLLVMWMAWLVWETGPASFDRIDDALERRGVVAQAHDEGPARAAMATLKRRLQAG